MRMDAWGIVIAVILLSVIFIVLIYDVAVQFSWIQAQTASHYIMEWSSQFPIIPLVVGLVLGHLFWGRK